MQIGRGSGGDAEGDTYIAIENVIGSSYGDIIIGGSSANVTLDGGDGDDTIVVNASNTTVIGGGGSDTVSYANATAAVKVNLQTGPGEGGAAGATDVDAKRVGAGKRGSVRVMLGGRRVTRK